MNDEESTGPDIGYTATLVVCDILFGMFPDKHHRDVFSRQHENPADHGAVQLLATPTLMIAPLHRQGGIAQGELPKNMAASGIAGGGELTYLLSSHPSIEDHILALSH